MIQTDMRIAALSPEKRALLEYKLAEKKRLEASASNIPSRKPNGAAPLSFAQERLWFLDQFEGGGAHYNVRTALQITGALNIEVLQRALEEILRRHGSLRTSFGLVHGSPVQIVEENVSLPFT